jgi:multiple sugar transport system permease protein
METSVTMIDHRTGLRWLSGKAVGQITTHLILLIVVVLSIGPFVWLVFGSFKPYRELVSSRALLPHTWTLENYAEILTRVNFAATFLNSVIVATTVTAVALLTSAAVGYVFGRYRFPGKQVLFTLLLSTMMVPFALVMVPLYLTIANFGLVNRLAGIIVTGLWSTFGIFLMRQFIEELPSGIFDSARIDGATEWRIFVTIVLPLSKAPLAALAIFTFRGNWDNFLWPLVVLNSPEKQTLPLLLNSLRSLYWTRYELWAAGSMLTIIPVMIIYVFASKQFIRGLALTGMKG